MLRGNWSSSGSRKQVSDQVKSNLLMSSLEQIDEDYKLEPITQPRLDVDAIEIPEKGPMNFEMDVEVRPQFEVPNYTGLKVKRPVAELTDKHVEEQLTRFLGGARPDRSQAGRGRRARRLSHGGHRVRRPGRAAR